MEIDKEPNESAAEVEVEEEAVGEEVVCEEGAPGWVVTFGDMMSLLLTFFILLLSFSTLDKVQFDKLSGVIKDGFGVITKTESKRIPKRDTMIKVRERATNNSRTRSNGAEARQLVEAIEATSVNDRAKSALEVFESVNSVKVSLPADDIFVEGTDQIRPEVHEMLDLLCVQARDIMSDKELAIEVRSAPAAKCDSAFLENAQCNYWKLTSFQAIAISRYMQEKGRIDASRIIPVGRATADPNFLNEEERRKKRVSTVEFIYVTPTQNLNR